jgi:hypothetical protein
VQILCTYVHRKLIPAETNPGIGIEGNIGEPLRR